MKKKYVKPQMEVYVLKSKPQILVGSGTDEWGYIPGITNEDEKHLA